MACRDRLAAAPTKHALQKRSKHAPAFEEGFQNETFVSSARSAVSCPGFASSGRAQSTPYPSANLPKLYEDLLVKINAIPIYDNHAHPGYADDSDVDAMAAPPEESSVLRLRDDNPEFVTAAKALFAYPYDDFKPEHAKWLADRKKAAEKSG